MSQYRIELDTGITALFVGYDSRTSMYFMYTNDKHLTNGAIHECETLEELLTLCKPYGKIPYDIQSSLLQERNSRESIAGSLAYFSPKEYRSTAHDANWMIERNLPFIETPNASIYFDSMKHHFTKCIEAYDAAFCAVYSLSDQKIIDCLSNLEFVSVLVDEEQAKRAEGKRYCSYGKLFDHFGIPGGYSSFIQIRYEDGEKTYGSHDHLYPITFFSQKVQGGTEKQYESFHSKFCVFADIQKYVGDTGEESIIIPRAVWIGSYNPTPTGDRSIQSAVLLRDQSVVLAHLSEFFALHRSARKARSLNKTSNQ